MRSNVRLVPIADIHEMTCAKQKARLRAVSPKSDQLDLDRGNPFDLLASNLYVDYSQRKLGQHRQSSQERQNKF